MVVCTRRKVLTPTTKTAGCSADTWFGMGIAISFRLCTYAILSTCRHEIATLTFTYA